MDLEIFSSNFQILIGLGILSLGNYLSDQIRPQLTGFFCDDDEIRYPLKPDTIIYPQMEAFYRIFGFLLMTASEYSCLRQLRESGYKLKSGYTGSITILGNHVWIALAYFTGCTGLDCLINITKRTASRLRPNFLDVCRPVNFTTLCPDGSRDFVESYTCGRKTFADEFLSFPSGHSAYCAFASTFIIIYLHYRCKLPYKTRQLLQFLFATVAFTISLSRIRDNKHRLSDVIGGGFLGTLFAVFYTRLTLNDFNLLKFSSYVIEIM